MYCRGQRTTLWETWTGGISESVESMSVSRMRNSTKYVDASSPWEASYGKVSRCEPSRHRMCIARKERLQRNTNANSES